MPDSLVEKNLKKLFGDTASPEAILEMDHGQAVNLYREYLNPVLAEIISALGLDASFTEAHGMKVKDVEGREYLDFLAGFGALNLGHEPETVLHALKLVEKRPNIFQLSINPFAAKLAEILALVTPGDLKRSFFCNSGAEAVEAAIKLARVGTGRKTLLYAEGSYHGKTLGALSVSGRELYKTPFAPLLSSTQPIPYGDVKALEEELQKGDVAGFIVEPIQGENGVVVPPAGYLKEVERLCRAHGALLLVDEVQTGMGRTGTLFCCEQDAVEPDVLILSKSLGGGVIPIGAIVAREEVWLKAYGTAETGLLHTSTFGGNGRACACAVAAFRAIVDQDLPSLAKKRGDVFIEKLNQIKDKHEIIEEVRGRGLMLGLKFSEKQDPNIILKIAGSLIKEHGIITAFTLNNPFVLRISPPLIISEGKIDIFINALSEVLTAIGNEKHS